MKKMLLKVFFFLSILVSFLWAAGDGCKETTIERIERPIVTIVGSQRKLYEEYSFVELKVNTFVAVLRSNENNHLYQHHLKFISTLGFDDSLESWTRRYPATSSYENILLHAEIRSRCQVSSCGVVLNSLGAQALALLFDADSIASAPFSIHIITFKPESEKNKLYKNPLIFRLVSCLPTGLSIRLSWPKRCYVTPCLTVEELFA
jgi:hypothetical protein